MKQQMRYVPYSLRTKGAKEELKLRAGEWKKIQCGRAHFDTLDVKFKHAVSPEEV